MKPIVQDEHPALRTLAVPVEESEFGTPELLALVQDMQETLDAAENGVALAAPQIGVSKRIFVVRYDRMVPPPPPDMPQPEPSRGVFINPEFVKASRKRDIMDEGCLSVHGLFGKTLRHVQATVEAREADGRVFTRGGGGVLAQAFQHEIDHLDGVLFIDHAADLKEVIRHEHE